MSTQTPVYKAFMWTMVPLSRLVKGTKKAGVLSPAICAIVCYTFHLCRIAYFRSDSLNRAFSASFKPLSIAT
jgi:hypothetical protein